MPTVPSRATTALVLFLLIVAFVFAGMLPGVFPDVLAGVAPGIAAAPRYSPHAPATDVGGEIAPGTVWTRDGSPYVSTSDVIVPNGVKLTIEPGAVVKLGGYHSLTVHGTLHALGAADDPITFERAGELPWSTIELATDSLTSTIGHAVLTGGGGGQRALITIATDGAEVHHASLKESDGLGIQITGGASPTVRDCKLDQVSNGTSRPPAALHIVGRSRAVIKDNFFQSNHEAVNWDASASPTFVGNRFSYNGYNGVRITGRVTGTVELASLGPRAWSYWIYGTGLDVASHGTLSLGPGTTMRFANGASLRVRGTLKVDGSSGAKVLLTDEREHVPGQWRELRFYDESIDYDEDTGEGSDINHLVVEYGGSSHTGSVYVDNCSPRIRNTTIRNSGSIGIGVRGPDAKPTLLGLDVYANQHDERGIGLEIQGSSQPDVSFSRFHDNGIGVRILDSSSPRMGPHNVHRGSTSYGMINEDPEYCVDASGNDWSATNGPLDQSPSPDACDQEDHIGNGELVSDNIRYEPFEGHLQAPYLDQPRCSTLSSTSVQITGFAPPDAEQVAVYDNQLEIGRAPVEQSAEGPATFTFTASSLEPGSHVLQLQSVTGELASGVSEPRNVIVDPDALVDASTLTSSYVLDGTTFVQPFVNDDGCTILRNDYSWRVLPLVGAPITIAAAITCPSGDTPSAEIEYLGAMHAMTEAQDGRLAATFEPSSGGVFDVRVACGGTSTMLHAGSISASTEGFVHDEIDGVLARVVGAEVTLMVQVPGTEQFVKWDGASYHGQMNPQITSAAGWYAFYPQPGTYKVLAEADEYRPYESEVHHVVDEPVMFPVPLRPIIVGQVFLPALQTAGQ